MLPQFRANGSEVLTFHRYVRLPERYLLMGNMSLPQQNTPPKKGLLGKFLSTLPCDNQTWQWTIP